MHFSGTENGVVEPGTNILTLSFVIPSLIISKEHCCNIAAVIKHVELY